MYEILCERCWHTEAVDGDTAPEHPCPECKAEGAWVGPYAQAPQDFSRRDSWPFLTSPHYQHAGRTDRRTRPR
jgi:hypothetical protein